MKPYVTFLKSIIVISSLLFVELVFSLQASAQVYDISGNYTINPLGGAFNPGINNNFLSFSEAADTLKSRGVNGAVILNVADGLYDESFEITSIPGASASNMITFQSASRDSSKVYLNFSGFSSGNPRICYLNGASYVSFRYLGFDATGGNGSYGQAFWIAGGSHHIYFENNNFIGKTTGTSSVNDNRALIFAWGNNVEFLEFRTNRFTFGEDGIKLSGTSAASGIIIENNQFYDQLESPIYVREMDAPVIINNLISLKAYTRKNGIHMELVDKGYRVSGNRISMNDCNAGIYIRDNDGNPGDEGMIFNNFISNSNGGGSNHGIWVYNSTYLKFFHNSVLLSNGWVITSRAFFQESGGNNLDVRNNSFVNKSGGYAFYASNASAIITVDYNNYYTNGNFLARWGSSDLPELSDIVFASGDDASSISANPWHFDAEDLHTENYRLESKGTNLLSSVPVDIDGEVRSATPDIGADEFTGSGSPMAGEYFIGGNAPDFATIAEATTSLNHYGVSGPVIFSIRDDNSPYVESINLESLTGVSATNTVTWRPDPANTIPVIITHDGSSGGNQTVHLVRTGFVTITGLTISADNTSNSTVIRLNGLCKNNTISACILNSLGTSSNNASVYSLDDLIEGLDINGNTFSGGYQGIRIDGLDNTSQKATGINVQNNTFSNHYTSGVYLRDCIAPVLTGNSFTHMSSAINYWGIFMEYCNNNYQVAGNKVVYSLDDGGIYLNYCTGSSSFVGKIYNNYVEMEGGSDATTGIYTANSSFVDVIFNTVKFHQGNSNASSNAYSNAGGSNITVRNNNFANFGSGRAYYNDNAGAIIESDHNNLFSGGNFLARWGSTEQRDLVDLRAASGKDQNSLNVNPWFLADGEPGINSSFLDGKGVQIPGVTGDYAGNTRKDPPDIGAVEFTPTKMPLAAGTYTVGGNSPDYATIIEGLMDVQLRGITGPVTLSIRSGEYNEHISTVNKIPGTNPSDTVVMKSETGNPEDVKIFHVTGGSGEPFNLINLKNVDYFTIQGITI